MICVLKLDPIQIPCLMFVNVYFSGVVFKLRSMPRVLQSETFRADKPFVYIIRDQSAQGLFWGSLHTL